MNKHFYKLSVLFFITFFVYSPSKAQSILNHTTTNVTTASVYDNGYLGHNFDASTGTGVKYTGSLDAMYTAGFIAGYSNLKMVGMLGSFTSASLPVMADMQNVTPFSGFTSNSNFNQIATATYNDNLAPAANKIGISVLQESMSNTSDNFVLISYRITNNSGAAITGLYTGVFADWDVGSTNYLLNRGGFDVPRSLVYCYENGGALDSRYYGFRALNGIAGGNVHDRTAFPGVRDSCYAWMKSTSYTPITVNGDMRSWISSGPYNIANGASVTVWFALVAGTNLSDMQANSDAAFTKWTNVVPVELTSFTAVANNGAVTLNWSTATEINNRGFEVQRKSANSDYSTVAFINGFGTTTEAQNYTFSEKVSTGKYSYRLKQVDFDGNSDITSAVDVDVVTPGDYMLAQNFPNPFNPTTTFSFSLADAGMVKLSVYNLLGQEIQTVVNEFREAGNYEVTFNASNLPSGTYFYKIQTPQFNQTKKMTLSK